MSSFVFIKTQAFQTQCSATCLSHLGLQVSSWRSRKWHFPRTSAHLPSTYPVPGGHRGELQTGNPRGPHHEGVLSLVGDRHTAPRRPRGGCEPKIPPRVPQAVVGRGAPQKSLGAGTRRVNGSRPQDRTGGALQHPATDTARGH